MSSDKTWTRTSNQEELTTLRQCTAPTLGTFTDNCLSAAKSEIHIYFFTQLKLNLLGIFRCCNKFNLFLTSRVQLVYFL